MAGRMGGVAPDHPEPDRPRGRRRERPAADQGRRSPAPRAASSSSAPPRREPDEGRCASEHRRRRVDAAGDQGRHRRAARRGLRRPGQHPADPPGRRRPAGRRPPGHRTRTKTRGEVRGGGRKPYKQKGTGRARQGSTRAPQFTGGGVVHGPTPRDYEPADAQEDEGRRPARRPLRPGPRRPRPRRHRPGRRRHALDQGRAGRRSRAISERRHVLVVARARRRPSPGRACATSTRVHLLVADQLNTYDVLVTDDVVFTRGALDAFLAGPRDGQVRQGRRHRDRGRVERRGGVRMSTDRRPARRPARAGRLREELRPARREQVHVPRRARTPTRPRSRSPSRRSSASRSCQRQHAQPRRASASAPAPASASASDTKRAIVTVADGDRIDIFGGPVS